MAADSYRPTNKPAATFTLETADVSFAIRGPLENMQI